MCDHGPGSLREGPEHAEDRPDVIPRLDERPSHSGALAGIGETKSARLKSPAPPPTDAFG